ncbi:MAG TPA: DUF1289 domain-containing protein [Geminicoccaceae bacterium]|nr:DUF1289 domain-containing protein [Geminicoccaceae bacterium]
MVRSPCIGVCTLDERTGTCTGCLRTLDEIAAWPTLSDDARRAVLARLTAAREAERGADAGSPAPPRLGRG